MARLLLLYVKDNDAAEAIVKSVLEIQAIEANDPGRAYGDKIFELGTLIAAYSKLEWVIARPLAWCKCTKSGKNRNWGWTKTKRFGWFVHSECNKSAYYVVQNFVTNLRVNNNDLLPEIKAKLAQERTESETANPDVVSSATGTS